MYIKIYITLFKNRKYIFKYIYQTTQFLGFGFMCEEEN